MARPVPCDGGVYCAGGIVQALKFQGWTKACADMLVIAMPGAFCHGRVQML
jgi:hypothetical protein